MSLIKTTPNRIETVKLVKKLLTASLILVACCFMLTAPVYAQNTQDTQDIVCRWVPGTDCPQAGDDTPANLAQSVTDVLTFLVGAISVIVVVIAGFIYVLSAGSPDKTKRARDAVLYAVIGIAVAATANLIVRFVLSSL